MLLRYNVATVKPVFKTTWEIGTTWELRTSTPVPRPIQYIELDLRNKITSEFKTVFHSPLGVPNSLYLILGVLDDLTDDGLVNSRHAHVTNNSLFTTICAPSLLIDILE